MSKMQCPACGSKYANGAKFCSEDGTKLLTENEVAGMIRPMKDPYNDPYGLWIVTTEGDEEGRTTRQLGSYEGYLDEIAHKLASEAFYTLEFSKANELPELKAEDCPNGVVISLDIGSGTWKMNSRDRAATIADLLKDRPVMVIARNQHSSVTLKFKEQS